MQKETFEIVAEVRITCSDGCELILSNPDRAVEALSLLWAGVGYQLVADECGGEVTWPEERAALAALGASKEAALAEAQQHKDRSK